MDLVPRQLRHHARSHEVGMSLVKLVAGLPLQEHSCLWAYIRWLAGTAVELYGNENRNARRGTEMYVYWESFG